MQKKTGLDRLRDLVGLHKKTEEKKINLIQPNFRGAMESLFRRGIELSQHGRQEEAIACFDEMLEENPNFFGAWCNKGVALLKLWRLQEAIDCFDRALQINPTDAMTWHNKGMTLVTLKKMDEAMKAFENAIQYAGPEDGLDLQGEQQIVDGIKSGRATFDVF